MSRVNFGLFAPARLALAGTPRREWRQRQAKIGWKAPRKKIVRFVSAFFTVFI